jgi:hypothetical protein
MFTKDYKLESQPSRQRYLYGKQVENLIIQCLRECGLEIEEADRKVDCVDKIDCFLVENGERKACSVKFRVNTSGNDILLDLFEPFYGINNENTKAGRDHVGQYAYYICLSNDGKTIRLVDGQHQKALIEDVLKEWEESHYELPVFNSKKHAGIQLRYTRDRANGRPKVLAFINPEIYKEDQIKLYEMKWPDGGINNA